ncbi:MAG: sensor histidine kinase [Chloroflexota bacterium]
MTGILDVSASGETSGVSEHSSAAGEHGVDSVTAYADILGEYFTSRAEEALYRASLLSQRYIEDGLGPEEIIAIHAESVDRVTGTLSYRERARASTDALQFLLEMMIAYGVQYRTYLDLRLRERERETEARLGLERQRAADAERSEHEKDEILATISHELRTPITAALGNVDLALRSVSNSRPDRLPRQLTAARDALSRLSRLTDELVNASRDDLLSQSFEPVDAGQVLQQATAWARPVADARSITLVCDDPGGCQTVADADALLTIFGNLLSNALRYTPPGGTVTASCGGDEELIWVAVADTGIGMTEDVRARIFEKFFRAPDAKSSEPQGLGLGLSIVQRLTASLNGNLTVESQPGKGSTFKLLLPRHEVSDSRDQGGIHGQSV